MPKVLCDPRERMLLEVERLLDQGGYGAVTVRAVALGCGVSIGTVYNYFPSKEALIAQYLLEDWHMRIHAIEAVSRTAQTPRPVAEAIYQQLIAYANAHGSVFRAEAAKPIFVGSFGQYHGLLRRQLASPLRPFCRSDFEADFLSEALLTWSMAEKAFQEIWDLLSPIIEKKE